MTTNVICDGEYILNDAGSLSLFVLDLFQLPYSPGGSSFLILTGIFNCMKESSIHGQCVLFMHILYGC